ncbi:hypothetical protein MVEN_00684200 [Mycena venus]|uniref:Uncharacterized protein n=1 Tax=Mycena venus TaxID=2733690 RepID=A0A8H7D2F4_9AGAR|nr:hypothetical protein MVEN_00684200 [Mycena venus]
MAQSILVAGVHTSLVALSSSSVTAVSASFLQKIAPDRRNDLLALTINGGPHGSFTTVLECSVQHNLALDVSLGLDWNASVREWLIGLNVPCGSDVIRGPLYAVKPSAHATSVPTAVRRLPISINSSSPTARLPSGITHAQPSSMPTHLGWMPSHPGRMPDHTWRMPDHTWQVPAHPGQKAISTEFAI